MTRWLFLFLLALLAGCASRKHAEAAYDYAPPMESAADYGGAGYGAAGAPPSRKESARGRAAPSPAMAGMDMADMDESSVMEAEEEPSTSTAPAATRMVHYDGYATLRVTRVEEGVDQVRAVAEEAGGHVERVGSSDITVRVPVARFREAFDRVLTLGEVLDKSLTAQDVTDAFTAVDLRLRTAEATRQRLQALLARAEEEQEKLELIRQIQRLTEEIDRLEAQVRALAGLAELSRISVQLVPREALAWQGPEAETAEMAWIRQLSPLRTEAPVVVKKLELAVPEGLVRLDEQGPYVAESPDGARIWAWRTENTPEGDAAFWLEAMKGRLGRDFARADAEVIGGFKVLRLVDRTEQPYTWMVAVRVEGRWLHVVQVFTPTPEATGRHEAAIRAVLLGGEA